MMIGSRFLGVKGYQPSWITRIGVLSLTNFSGRLRAGEEVVYCNS